MATPITLLYGTSNQTITLTGASLANNAARASSAIDNTSNLFEDFKVQITLTSGSTGTSATGLANIFVVASSDNGTTYGESATGSDAAITLTVPTNAKLIGSINVVANSKLYNGDPYSVSIVYGGYMPAKFVVILQNLSGHAFAATATVSIYQGVQHQA